MKTIPNAVLVLGALAFCGAAARADDLAAAEKQIIRNWQKHRSLKASVTRHEGTEARGNRAARRGEGTFESLRKGGRALFRYEMNSTWKIMAGEREAIVENKILIVGDGKYQYELSDNIGWKSACKRKPDPIVRADVVIPADIKALFERLRADYQLELLEEDSVDGHDAFVIEATRKSRRGGATRKRQAYYFSKEHGMLLKLEERDRKGKAISSLMYTDLEFDTEIDPKRFEFQAPEGVIVEDKTGP
jgi:outer membrane lipoprotein-sorting protein